MTSLRGGGVFCNLKNDHSECRFWNYAIKKKIITSPILSRKGYISSCFGSWNEKTQNFWKILKFIFVSFFFWQRNLLSNVDDLLNITSIYECFWAWEGTIIFFWARTEKCLRNKSWDFVNYKNFETYNFDTKTNCLHNFFQNFLDRDWLNTCLLSGWNFCNFL